MRRLIRMGDPMRSPDGAGGAAGGNAVDDDGFSSSRSGIKASPDENEKDAKAGKSGKVKTRDEVLKEDIDVGNFYLDKRNWKGAQDRFASAFKLDAENENAVFGLAEAEQRLELYDKAREHYELFLSYDPDGPHSKVARKALEQVEAAQSKTVGAAHTGASKSGPN